MLAHSTFLLVVVVPYILWFVLSSVTCAPTVFILMTLAFLFADLDVLLRCNKLFVSFDVHDLVVHGMLHLRQFYFICGASMCINTFNPILLGFNDGHWILCSHMACFGALFCGFVPDVRLSVLCVSLSLTHRRWWY